jgi:hypothetical protein
LDLCHYYLHDFEEHHYYSSNCAGAITILHLFEIRHFVRQTPSVAHLQAYRRPSYFRMDGFALPSHFTVRDPHVSLLQPPAPPFHRFPPSLSLIWGPARSPPSVPPHHRLPPRTGRRADADLPNVSVIFNLPLPSLPSIPHPRHGARVVTHKFGSAKLITIWNSKQARAGTHQCGVRR